jgi:hypothetical protein
VNLKSSKKRAKNDVNQESIIDSDDNVEDSEETIDDLGENVSILPS